MSELCEASAMLTDVLSAETGSATSKCCSNYQDFRIRTSAGWDCAFSAVELQHE